MADRTKSIPKGIVENLLVKIGKLIFLVDFVILYMVKDFRMLIILGRSLVAMAQAKVDVFEKLISLEVGNGKVVFKIEENFNETLTPIESVCAIRNEESIMDDDLIKIDHDLDKMMELILDVVEAMLDDDWFKDTISDEDDLDGIVDYLELKSHDDFVDINDKAYKERMCKFLGVAYKKPSPILIEKVEVTRCVPCKPSRDITRPLGIPSGLKGLLHMLNATVIAMKDLNIAYGSEHGALLRKVYLQSFRVILKGVFPF
nr:hypothetical protein [Tanacetum cinerariifolium]GFA00387.1 hypothetical protein [Tanacetum cinerariifolium]